MTTLLGMTQSAYDPASRVRFIQYMPGLRQAGWKVDFAPNRPDRQWRSGLRWRLPSAVHYRAGRAVMKGNRLLDVRRAQDYDAVFVNRDLGGPGLRLEKALLRRNPRVVFDFDDAIFAFPSSEPTARWMCEHASWVTPGNAYLADYARQFTDRVTIIPTVIDTDRYLTHGPFDSPGPVRVGWTGSDQSIATTLVPHLPALAAAQQELDFELVIITNTRPTLPVSLRWTFIPWTPETEGQLGEVFEVGIMPLVDDSFQQGKCGLKLLQCMAAGLPTIASPVGVNREIVRPGETGFLASSPSEWHDALTALVGSADLRAAMGKAGRQRCEQDYSLRRWTPVLLDVLDRVRQHAEPTARLAVPGRTPSAISIITPREDQVATEVETWITGAPASPSSAADAGGLTVGICTYRRPAAVLRLIESVRRQSRRPEYLIIADASPDDATEQALLGAGLQDAATAGVLYLRTTPESRGLPRQRNLVLERTCTELIAFFDDDIILEPACLAELERVHRSLGEEVVGVGAVARGQSGPPGWLWQFRKLARIVPDLWPGRYYGSGMSTPWTWEGPAEGWSEGDWLPGYAMMWKTAAAKEVGFWTGFQGYAQGEDLEFSLRMRSRGRLVLAGAAQVDHRHDSAGRPDDYRLGYMALYNRYQIHRRGLRNRDWRDVLWFAYAWAMDTILLSRSLVRVKRAPGTLRQIAGRCAAARDILRGR